MQIRRLIVGKQFCHDQYIWCIKIHDTFARSSVKIQRSSSSLIGHKNIFCGQSEVGNSNASGTGSVSAQGLVSFLQ